MSKYMVISCTMCGRDLYRPLTTKELRECKHVHFPGFYISQNKSGKEEEYCEKCYEAMLKEEDQSDINKHMSESEEISREEIAALLARGDEEMTREEAINMLKSKMDGHTDTSYEWVETVRMAIKSLEQEPETAHWTKIVIGFDRAYVRCSKCCEWSPSKDRYTFGYNFCPICGAKIVKQQESEEKK